VVGLAANGTLSGPKILAEMFGIALNDT